MEFCWEYVIYMVLFVFLPMFEIWGFLCPSQGLLLSLLGTSDILVGTCCNLYD